jgi:hypothetical protein
LAAILVLVSAEAGGCSCGGDDTKLGSVRYRCDKTDGFVVLDVLGVVPPLCASATAELRWLLVLVLNFVVGLYHEDPPFAVPFANDGCCTLIELALVGSTIVDVVEDDVAVVLVVVAAVEEVMWLLCFVFSVVTLAAVVVTVPVVVLVALLRFVLRPKLLRRLLRVCCSRSANDSVDEVAVFDVICFTVAVVLVALALVASMTGGVSMISTGIVLVHGANDYIKQNNYSDVFLVSKM